jgi:sec-independent protein translocase protein TatA
MPFGLGFGELLLIFAVLLMLFGAKRLPEVASGMGKGIRDFKRAINGLDEQTLQASQAPAPALQPTQAAAPAVAAPVAESKPADA